MSPIQDFKSVFEEHMNYHGSNRSIQFFVLQSINISIVFIFAKIWDSFLKKNSKYAHISVALNHLKE